MESELLISIDAAPASDSWGFVGRVLIGDLEAYRTIRAYASPTEAAEATSHLLAGVLGPLLAGQEWNSANDEFGHAPLRTELGFGLRGRRGRHHRASPAEEGPASST
jgi:hypothetical protein